MGQLIPFPTPEPTDAVAALQSAKFAVGWLIELRNSAETRNDVEALETELWSLLNQVQWLVSEIKELKR